MDSALMTCFTKGFLTTHADTLSHSLPVGFSLIALV